MQREFDYDKLTAEGIRALPNGSAYCAYLLAGCTTTELDARQIHQLGLAEVARIRAKMEAFREQDGMAAFYMEGTIDGSRPGTCYLHLSDMTALNRTDIATTTYPVGLPGHHLQGAIALERTDLHDMGWIAEQPQTG